MSLAGSDHQQRYFRSIDELQNTPEFEQFLTREFPQAASEFPEGVSRRRWLQMMSASLALGGMVGCRYNREEVAAFVVRPEGRVPGLPERFATNFEWAGRTVNALITSLEGRPVHVDGNADHPSYANSQPSDFTKNDKIRAAGTDVFAQASILSLYDQDRIPGVLQRSKPGDAPTRYVKADKKADPDDHKNSLKSFDAFGEYVAASRQALAANQGAGLAILYEPTRSPSLRRVLADVVKKYPKAKLVRYESVYTGNVSKAIDAAGAGKSSVMFDLDKAKVIVSLDADVLSSFPDSVHYSRQYANHRSPTGPWMNRLYCVESQYSSTGSAADFRLALQSSQIPVFLRKIEEALDANKVVEDREESVPYNKADKAERVQRTIDSIVNDLLANKGESILVVGSQHSMAVQLAALRINAKLGNIGKTVNLYEIPDELSDVPTLKLDDFVKSASQFQTLWILAPNPVFSVAGDLKLADALKSINDVVYLSNYDDETAAYCDWTYPATHPFEAWGDVQSTDGVLGIGQPMIDPLLVGSKSPIEFLSIMADLPETDGQKIVMETARQLAGSLSERQWKEALHIGYVAGTGGKTFSGQIKADAKSLAGGDLSTSMYELPEGEIRLDLDPNNLEVVVLPSDTVYDGRLGNNGWLQELPQPITKLVWDNAAVCSISTAKALGLKQGELVSLKQGQASVKLPVFVVPGMAEGSFTVNLGYGRAKGKGGVVGSGVGTNIASFRRWNQASIYNGIDAIGTSEPYRLASTQDHFALEDTLGMSEQAKRSPQLVREGTLDEYKSNADFTRQIVEHHFENNSLWDEPKVDQNHAWGMTIDLNKCSGCNACVVACQAENNVPIVGKEQVIRNREMHWLRIDRYFKCDVDATTDFRNPVDATVVTQPMACAHCETAPCEEVCPVAATVHTEEGINAMAYNRCIGTRYCGNNCPFKVRRFNYFNYNKEYGYFYGWQDRREHASAKLQSLVLNPDVTVRGRGVMEKCTYCIQRIQNGKIKARQTGDGKVHDGDIQTACQVACSSHAIIFGDLNDKTSRVYQSQQDPRAYAVLEELNIKPRTLYLSRIRNVPKRLMTETQKNPPRPGLSGHGHDHSTESGDHGHHS